MSEKFKTEDVVRNFFADHETWGIEGAYLKHMDDQCVLTYDEYPELVGIKQIMEKVKKFTRIYKRPYARIIIGTTSTDKEHNNAFMVEYELFTFNRETGDTFKLPMMSVIEINERGKITRKVDGFDMASLIIGEAMPGLY